MGDNMSFSSVLNLKQKAPAQTPKITLDHVFLIAMNLFDISCEDHQVNFYINANMASYGRTPQQY